MHVALNICESGLADKENWESTYFEKIQPKLNFDQ